MQSKYEKTDIQHNICDKEKIALKRQEEALKCRLDNHAAFLNFKKNESIKIKQSLERGVNERNKQKQFRREENIKNQNKASVIIQSEVRQRQQQTKEYSLVLY